MSAVFPVPGPDAPLRCVREREQRQNFLQDTLDCGHVVIDYDNRPVGRRRCQACATHGAHVRLGQGVIEVLQLDDVEMRRALGVEWTPAGRRYIRVTGNLASLRAALVARCGAGWDQPSRYVAAARAAIKRLDAAQAMRA